MEIKSKTVEFRNTLSLFEIAHTFQKINIFDFLSCSNIVQGSFRN